jgi:hypothetical protein
MNALKSIAVVLILITSTFTFAKSKNLCQVGQDRIAELGQDGEDFTKKEFEKYAKSCLTIATNDENSDLTRSKAYLTYSALMGKTTSKISLFRFKTKIDYGKKAYEALKEALLLDEYNIAGVIGISKTILGFHKNDPPQWVLDRAGLENIETEASLAMDYVENLITNEQEFNTHNEKVKNQIIELREKLSSI